MSCLDTAVRPTQTPDEQRETTPALLHSPRAPGRACAYSAQSQARCDDVFVAFVRANTAALTRTACVLTGSAPAGEELVQDTLVRLYPQWARVENADVPLAYVRRAMTNRFLTQWRRTTQREVVTDAVPDRTVEHSAQSNFVDRDEIRMVLRTVSQRQRTALVLRYYEGLSDVEIAEAIGARPGTVRSLISRGLATLHETAPRVLTDAAASTSPALLRPSRPNPKELS